MCEQREPLTIVVLKVLCLLVLVVDVTAVPGVWQWRSAYLSVAALIILWRVTRRVWFLNAYATLFGATSVTRAFVLVLDGDRWSGAAINLLLALLTYSSLRNYRRSTMEVHL